MNIGRMDRRIALQSYAAPSGGDPTAGSYTTRATVWAERLDPKGMERFAGVQMAARATQAYRIRYRTDISPDPTWRVLDGTEEWDVEAVLPGSGRNEEWIIPVNRLDPDDE